MLPGLAVYASEALLRFKDMLLRVHQEVQAILDMTGRDEFYRYQHIRNDDICLDIEEQEKKRLADGEAKRIMA